MIYEEYSEDFWNICVFFGLAIGQAGTWSFHFSAEKYYKSGYNIWNPTLLLVWLKSLGGLKCDIPLADW